MRNKNKTALTAEDNIIWWFMQFCEAKGDYYIITDKNLLLFSSKLSEDTSLQTKEKDKEIEQCKNLANIQQKRWIERNEKLQSTIESQQKEIEELKTSIEGVFGWREKNHHLTISEKQLKSQLSEVTKERDEAVRNAFNESRLTHPMVGFKHDTFEDYLKSLTPTKE